MTLKQRTSQGKSWRVTVEKFSCCDACCNTFEPYTPTYWTSKETGYCYNCATTKPFEEKKLEISDKEKLKILDLWEPKSREYFSQKQFKKLKSDLFK